MTIQRIIAIRTFRDAVIELGNDPTITRCKEARASITDKWSIMHYNFCKLDIIVKALNLDYNPYVQGQVSYFPTFKIVEEKPNVLYAKLNDKYVVFNKVVEKTYGVDTKIKLPWLFKNRELAEYASNQFIQYFANCATFK